MYLIEALGIDGGSLKHLDSPSPKPPPQRRRGFLTVQPPPTVIRRAMNPQLLVQEFMTSYDQNANVPLQLSLVREEFLELQEALQSEDRWAQAKELADLLYVVYGLAEILGIDAHEVLSDVHESNMSKIDEDGSPIYDEAGKVLKGPNYMPPIPRKDWFVQL